MGRLSKGGYPTAYMQLAGDLQSLMEESWRQGRWTRQRKAGECHIDG